MHWMRLDRSCLAHAWGPHVMGQSVSTNSLFDKCDPIAICGVRGNAGPAMNMLASSCDIQVLPFACTCAHNPSKPVQASQQPALCQLMRGSTCIPQA